MRAFDPINLRYGRDTLVIGGDHFQFLKTLFRSLVVEFNVLSAG